MEYKSDLQSDLSSNVSWFPKDLEFYENQSKGLDLMSLLLTIARSVTLIIAVIVHRSFYRVMKRLPGRPINQMIYPHMVSLEQY